MKKLKLEALEISAGGRLTRAQLRNVVGGSVGTHCDRDIDCNQYGVACINYICTPIVNCSGGCPWPTYCLNNQCVS